MGSVGVKEERGSMFSSRAIILVVLVGLFVFPICFAWLIARSEFFSNSAQLVNNGSLLNPPISIDKSNKFDDLNNISLRPGQWAIIYFDVGECHTACLDALGVLQKVWLVLGHDGQRVKVRSVVSGATTFPSVENIADNQLSSALGAEIGARLKLEESPTSGVVFLDWRGQIMLYFSDLKRPGLLKKDIKRLLRGSRVN